MSLDLNTEKKKKKKGRRDRTENGGWYVSNVAEPTIKRSGNSVDGNSW